MSKYRHNPAPNHRAKQFAAYCAEHIAEWPRGQFAATAGKFKKLHFAERVDGLSPAVWATCSRKQWLQAKTERAAQPPRAQSAKSTGIGHAHSANTITAMLVKLIRFIAHR